MIQPVSGRNRMRTCSCGAVPARCFCICVHHTGTDDLPEPEISVWSACLWRYPLLHGVALLFDHRKPACKGRERRQQSHATAGSPLVHDVLQHRGHGIACRQSGATDINALFNSQRRIPTRMGGHRLIHTLLLSDTAARSPDASLTWVMLRLHVAASIV